MVVAIKLLMAILAMVVLIFGSWLVFIGLLYFAIFMTAVVGLTGVSEYLKGVNNRMIIRLGNVFRKKQNRKSTTKGTEGTKV
mgnify:CR=1 FL=1